MNFFHIRICALATTLLTSPIGIGAAGIPPALAHSGGADLPAPQTLLARGGGFRGGGAGGGFRGGGGQSGFRDAGTGLNRGDTRPAGGWTNNAGSWANPSIDRPSGNRNWGNNTNINRVNVNRVNVNNFNGRAGWYGGWSNASWGWWGASAAAWGIGSLATAAVINNAVNDALSNNQTTIVVPNTNYQLLFGSVQATGTSTINFVVNVNGSNYNLNADCQAGLLDGQPPNSAEQAQVLNSACQVAFGNS